MAKQRSTSDKVDTLKKVETPNGEDQFQRISETLEILNTSLKDAGFCEIALVRPEDCIAADINARYWLPEAMQIFTENLRKDKRLESMPLVWRDPELPADKYRIISGHHRVDAAKVAGIKFILVMVATPESREEVVSKQLAHNALNGMDDKAILAQMFNSISNIALKFATGLTDEISAVSYTSINFKAGIFKDFTVLFLPEDIKGYDASMDQLVEAFPLKASTTTRIAPLSIFEDFKNAIIRIKRVENIKSNATALTRLVELASEKLAEMTEDERSRNNEE